MHKDECITLDTEDNVTGHANKYVARGGSLSVSLMERAWQGSLGGWRRGRWHARVGSRTERRRSVVRTRRRWRRVPDTTRAWRRRRQRWRWRSLRTCCHGFGTALICCHGLLGRERREWGRLAMPQSGRRRSLFVVAGAWIVVVRVASAAPRRIPMRNRVAPGGGLPARLQRLAPSHAHLLPPRLHPPHSRYVTHQFNTKQPRGILHRAFSVFLFDEQVRRMAAWGMARGAWRHGAMAPWRHGAWRMQRGVNGQWSMANTVDAGGAEYGAEYGVIWCNMVYARR